MRPLLPQDDPLAPARRTELAHARDSYRYDYSSDDILYCKEVPLTDRGSLSYWAGLARVSLEVAVNKAVTTRPEEAAHALRDKLASLASKLGPEQLAQARARLMEAAGGGTPTSSTRSPRRPTSTVPTGSSPTPCPRGSGTTTPCSPGSPWRAPTRPCSPVCPRRWQSCP